MSPNVNINEENSNIPLSAGTTDKDNTPVFAGDAPAAAQNAPAAAETQVIPAAQEAAPVFAGGDPAAQTIPELSQREREHLTFLRVLGDYNIAKQKRHNYRRYGAWFIIITGILFLTLIFSLDAKILFLCLWIISILGCVAVMIKADYDYEKLKEYLDYADELDFFEKDDEEEEE